MNKEFKLLEDGNMEVTDEKGNVTVRYCGNSIQSELLSENKTELINEKQEKAEKKLKEDKEVKKLSKVMLLTQPVFVATMTLLGALYGIIVNPANILVGAIMKGTTCLVASSMAALIATAYWTVVSVVSKKRIKEDEAMIKSIEIIKNNFEKENSKIKEEDYSRRGIYPNITFNLESDTQKIDEALTNQINMVYDSNKGYSPKLVKRK